MNGEASFCWLGEGEYWVTGVWVMGLDLSQRLLVIGHC